ncbi:MAG: ATP-binding protein, partial [Micromonosporaceae bacterium]|nr:ATP-binding protein [Micromonosporaceae bacterium]
MTAPVVRRLRLPAAQSSPAAARAVVSEAVHEVGLTSVLDEAMLLTTELVTNGVVHARTELEIDLVATRDAISVMVLDHHCGPLSLAGWDAQQPGTGAGGTPAQLRERGRGLLLVDRLADRWGTLHHSGGKGVWFRLAGPDSDAPAQGMTPSRAPGPAPGVSAAPGAVG